MNRELLLKLRTVYILLLAAAVVCLACFSFLDRLTAVGETGPVRPLTEVTYAAGTGEGGSLTLPARLEDLPPRTPVVLSARLTAEPRESLLVKTVFAPVRIYLNDALVYSGGQAGSYPSYMNDPPTLLFLIPLPDSGEPLSLRAEYLSPTQRGTLSLPAMYVGEETGLLARQFYTDGFSFVFSLLLIFIGLVMVLISLAFVRKLPAGSSFLWLGLFSLAAGIWVLGECDLTAFFLPYPTLLYTMAYLGLFTVALPFLRFGLVVLRPRSKLPLRIMLAVHALSLGTVLALQLSGAADFTKTLYWFHLITPLAFVTFALCLVWEYCRHRNGAARRFAPAILLLAASTVLEVLNYWLNLAAGLTLFFQLGVLAFVLALGVASGHYVRESLTTAAEKTRLEYEMAALGRQLELQRLQYRSMAEHDDRIKAQRHDLRHQLTVLRTLSEDKDRLRAYIDGLIAQIPGDRETLLCENYAVNAVAAHYTALARQAGIDISLGLAVPAELEGGQEIDLCVIVGNLLENALEACSRQGTGRETAPAEDPAESPAGGPDTQAPFIRVSSRLQHGVLTLAVDNSFDGVLQAKDGVFLSAKREGEGTGLPSVRAVAEKYGGGARFTAEGGIFAASVYLRLG